MERTRATVNGGEGELLSLLSGSGTPQVDIVFYVILHSKFVPTGRMSLWIGIHIFGTQDSNQLTSNLSGASRLSPVFSR